MNLHASGGSRGNRVSKLVVAILLGATFLAPAALAEGPLIAIADRSAVPVGDTILVRVEGSPGALASFDGAEQVLNEHGIALFPVSRAVEGTVSLVATASGGASARPLELTWIQARLAISAPEIRALGQSALFGATLTWGANLTPVIGAQLSLAIDHQVNATAITDELGQASFLTASAALGVREYHVVVDDPLLRHAIAAANVVWVEAPAPPPPPPPPGNDPPPPVPVTNRAPVLGEVTIDLRDGFAVARATAADPDGESVFLAYSWIVNGVPMLGPSVPVAPGASVQLTVLAVDGRGASASRVVTIIAPPAARSDDATPDTPADPPPGSDATPPDPSSRVYRQVEAIVPPGILDSPATIDFLADEGVQIYWRVNGEAAWRTERPAIVAGDGVATLVYYGLTPEGRQPRREVALLLDGFAPQVVSVDAPLGTAPGAPLVVAARIIDATDVTGEARLVTPGGQPLVAPLAREGGRYVARFDVVPAGRYTLVLEATDALRKTTTFTSPDLLVIDEAASADRSDVAGAVARDTPSTGLVAVLATIALTAGLGASRRR